MKKIWEYNKGYNIARWYVDLCTRTHFSFFKIEGRENLPQDGTCIYAPNHRAAMVDPLIILLLSRGVVGFGARADIFRNPKIGAILRWLRIIPFARERDGKDEILKNYGTFDEIIDCLDHNVPFCMFSEGTHRAERGTLPIKKGIFRIAKMAQDKLQKPIYIVPMGCDYEFFFRQGGKAALRIGEPIEIGTYFAEHSDLSEMEIMRSLCAELQIRIRSLIDRIPEHHNGHIALRSLLCLAALPLFVSCGIASLPIWLPAKLILRNMEDKAWSHTVFYVCRIIFPILWPFFALFSHLNVQISYLIKDILK